MLCYNRVYGNGVLALIVVFQARTIVYGLVVDAFILVGIRHNEFYSIDSLFMILV